MTTHPAQPAVPDLTQRPVPRLGGFNPTLLGMETRRLLRNRRTLIFTIALPSVFFLLFGMNDAYAGERVGNGNVAGFIAVSMALYGAVLATTSGGSSVSIERAAGWSRQLRLTPLSPAAYVATKMLTALVLSASSILAVYLLALVTRKAAMPTHVWLLSGLVVWAGSLLFAAFGLFMGYLMPTENVMQVLSFALVLFAFAGGLFIPLDQFPGWFQAVAEFTPLWGLNQLVHAPFAAEPFNAVWVVNALVWLVVFVCGAAWRFRQDTARV